MKRKTDTQQKFFDFSWKVSGWTYGMLEAGAPFAARFMTIVQRRLRSTRTGASSSATRVMSRVMHGLASAKRKG